MALAIVRWLEEESDGHQLFDVRLGANRFYSWAVGSGSRRVKGVRMLTSTSRRSPLLGPLEPGDRGRTMLRVPGDAFDADHHHLQLLSFRDERMRGPAASPIVDVPWRWSPERSRRGDAPADRAAASSLPARLSHAQFLDALAGIVSQVLPAVQKALPVLGQLFGGAQKAPAAPGPGAQAGPGQAAAPQPDLAQLLAALLAQLQKAATPQSSAASLPAPARSRRYSHASWVQLLAALPALAPLLEKVLTPETIKTVVEAADPTKMLKTVFSGLADAAKIGQEATDKLHEHLRALNPGIGDDLAAPLLAGLSGAASSRGPRHLISRHVRLGVTDLAPAELGGYPQVAFRSGDQITLPVTVDTPRPIPAPTLLVRVKDADDLRVLAERSWTYERLDAGRLPAPAVLPAALTHRLPAGREYLVDLTLTWRGRDGLVGATITQLIRLVGERTFDTVQTAGPPVRLDDVTRDREWWHRVWTGELADGLNRVEATLRYGYRMDPRARERNRRVDTRADLAPAGRRRLTGTIDAGLDVSPAELSRLAVRLGSAPFDEDTMAALADPSFRAAFARDARATVAVHARRGAQVAVWVWPEVTLHTAMFRVPRETSPLTGQVLAFDTVPVAVPVPALAHVVATRSG